MRHSSGSIRILAAMAALLLLPAPAFAAGVKLLVFAGINFTLYGILLFVLLRKPVREFLSARKLALEAEMQRVAAERARLDARLTELEGRHAGLADEQAALLAESRATAEQEAARIRREAEALAADMLEATKQRISGMQRDLKAELVNIATAAVLEQAEGRLQDEVDNKRDAALSDDLLGRLEAAK